MITLKDWWCIQIPVARTDAVSVNMTTYKLVADHKKHQATLTYMFKSFVFESVKYILCLQCMHSSQIYTIL